MERLQAGGGLDAVGNAYRMAQGAARDATPFWLRWRYRRLNRIRDRGRLDAAGLAELRAVVDEIRARGMELPA